MYFSIHKQYAIYRHITTSQLTLRTVLARTHTYISLRLMTHSLIDQTLDGGFAIPAIDKSARRHFPYSFITL